MASDYTKHLYKDYEKLQNKYDNKCKEFKLMELKALVAEDNEARLQRIVDKKASLLTLTLRHFPKLLLKTLS